MRHLLISFLSLCVLAIAGSLIPAVTPAGKVYAAPQVIGHGCTTAFFIDDDCDGCGVGVKASGTYPITQNPPAVGAAAYYTTGDKPDADDTDVTVCTTADWQAKWGSNNAGMVSFLNTVKNFANTSRIWYVSPSGNDSTGVMNDPTHPYLTMATPMTTLEDLQGGVIIIRATSSVYLSPCSFNGGNPCFELSGSAGHPLLVMAYPGEVAQVTASAGSGNGWDAVAIYAPGKNSGWVTLDGLTFLDPIYGQGDAIFSAYTTNLTVTNCEFAGWHQTIFAARTINALNLHNVYHDMYFHAIYYSFGSAGTINQGPGDFNFALDQARYLANNSEGASYNGQIIGSIFYSSGQGGYEPIHINSFMDYAVVEGNITSFGGGAGVAFQAGVYNGWIADNIIFDNGRDCFTFYPYQDGTGHTATVRYVTIVNNTCYVGNPNDTIRATNPNGGLVAKDANTTPGYYIKNITIKKNIFVTYDNGASTDPIPLKYETRSYPETDVIQDNLFWSTGPTSGRVMWIDTDASPAGGAGTYTFIPFQAFNANFSGNVYADPQFTAASPTYLLTPGAFNFTVPSTSPAYGLGADLSVALPTPPAIPITLPPAPAVAPTPSPPTNVTTH